MSNKALPNQYQQYSRQNYMIIHGIPYTKGEDTDKEVLKFSGKNKRIFKEEKKKSRLIIVKFARDSVLEKVFKNKKKSLV